MPNTSTPDDEYIMHGMMSSYFTKKLEAYFLSKGIPFQSVEMDGPDMQQCAEKVGVKQLPQVQCPDGTWLTDTTQIMAHFESDDSLPTIRPKDPFTAFCSSFLEDCFDEWYWAPALYYRWAFKMDQKRRAEEFSYTIMDTGMKLPRSLCKAWVIWRQKSTHLKQNGIVSAEHARQTEELYLETLDMLQPVFAKRPYLFGERPCEADFGLFGPMFPHFGCDPTPQEIMLVRAPHLFRWLGRLWSTRPEELQAAPELTGVPEDLQPIMQKMGREYLPYLVANQKAFQSGAATTRYKLGALDWEVLTAPYRVYCLTQLQARFQALSGDDQQKCGEFLGHDAVEILSQPVDCPPEMQNVTASRPAQGSGDEAVGRLWQSGRASMESLIENLARKKKSRAVAEKKKEGTSWLPIYFRRYRAN